MGKQVARIVKRELRKAAATAGRRPGDASIHDARKRIKKVRSVIHLLRQPLDGDYSKLDEGLRSAAHRLAAVRDADSLVNVMRSLGARYHDVITVAALTRAKSTLTLERREANAKLAGSWAGVRQILTRSRHRLQSVLPAVTTRRGIRRGLIHGYRRARRAMTANA
jgi:hypothetical protein